MANRKHGATRTAPKAGNVYQQCIVCHAERLVEKDGQPLKTAGKWSARWCMSVGEAEAKKFANCEHIWRRDADIEKPPSLDDRCDECGVVYSDIVTVTQKELVSLPSKGQPLDVKLIDREYEFVHRSNCHCSTDDHISVCRICWVYQGRRKGAHAPDCLDCDAVKYQHLGKYPHESMGVHYLLTDEELAFCDEIAKQRQALAEEKRADESKSVGEKSKQAHRLHMIGVCAKYVWHRLRLRESDEIKALLLDPFTGGEMTLGVDDVMPPGQTLVVRGRTALRDEKTRLTMPIDKGRDIEADFIVLVEFTPRSRRVTVIGYMRRDMWIDWREAIDIRHGHPTKTTPTWVYRGPMLDINDLLELCGIELPAKDLGGAL